MKKKTFLMACVEFFGYKQGQGLQEFNKEFKALTNKDRRDIAEGFKMALIDIDETTIESDLAAKAEMVAA